MRHTVILIAACASMIASSAFAHPRAHAKSAHAPVTAVADAEPRVRIRGDRQGGLSEQGFSHWIYRHPALLTGSYGTPSMRILASVGAANRTLAGDFALADRNRDRRVSARELADFVSAPADMVQGYGRTAPETAAEASADSAPYPTTGG